MVKAERERIVAEALEFVAEMPFPGWTIDKKVDGALLESYLVVYPNVRLVPMLAAMRARWYPEGKATPKTWRARLRNWLKMGVKYDDPLVVGQRAEGTGERAGGPSEAVRRAPRPVRSPEAKEAELTADQVRTWHDQPWARGGG